MFSQLVEEVHNRFQLLLMFAQKIRIMRVGVVLCDFSQHLAILADFGPAGVNRTVVADGVREVVIYVAPGDIEEPPFKKRFDTRVKSVLKRVHVVVAVPAKDIDSTQRRITVFGMISDARDFFHQQGVQAEIPEAWVRHHDLHGRIEVARPDSVDVIQSFVKTCRGRLGARGKRKMVVVIMGFS